MGEAGDDGKAESGAIRADTGRAAGCGMLGAGRWVMGDGR